MTDAEIDALARELLADAIHTVNAWDSNFFHEVLQLPDGELIPIYGGTSEEGFGSYLCEFMPLATVKTIIVESEKIHDEFVLSLDTKENLSDHNKRILKDTYSKGRDRSIRLMARTTTLHLIAFFHARLADMIEEAVKDCLIMAGGFVALTLAEVLDPYAPEPVKIDARKTIDEAAERVATKKRKFLTGHIQDLPYFITHRGRGAPLKSPLAREQEREEFTAKIESAYRALRKSTGKKPTKKSVAEKLRLGGVNPRTGTDSRLNTFNTKLKRLGINYDAIAARIEVESTQ